MFVARCQVAEYGWPADVLKTWKVPSSLIRAVSEMRFDGMRPKNVMKEMSVAIRAFH